jgi:predicted small secreted protein
MMNRLAVLLALVVVGVAATACNTIEGAGKDIKAAGGAIEKSAGKTKTY